MIVQKPIYTTFKDSIVQVGAMIFDTEKELMKLEVNNAAVNTIAKQVKADADGTPAPKILVPTVQIKPRNGN